MNRRSFLKATTAALLVPRIDLRLAVDREALLLPFCDTYVSRYDLGKPFLCDVLTYATDGRSAIRTELERPVTNGEGRFPKMLDCWREFWKPASAFRVEGLPGLDDLRDLNWDFGGYCPECNGRRISLGEENPHGRYSEQWLEVHEYDVDDDTILDPSCQRCRGLRYRGPWLAEVCGELLRYSHAKRIFALPGVQVCRGEHEHSILFRADGFEGIALGISGFSCVSYRLRVSYEPLATDQP